MSDQLQFLNTEENYWLDVVRDEFLKLSGLVGVWVHGSAVTGDWIPGSSDIDIIACMRSDLDEHQGITGTLENLLPRCPGASADIHVVTSSSASTPSRSPCYIAYGAIHDGPTNGNGVSGPGEDPLLLFDFELTRTYGKTLVGPEPRQVFGVVPHRWLLEAAEKELEQWEAYPNFHQPHMAVLQAARALAFANDGKMLSKIAAGTWARGHWRSADVIDHAIAWQRGRRETNVDEAGARKLLAQALEDVRARLATYNNP